MTARTPSDIHVGAVVILPSGAVGKVTSRQAGPLTMWGVNDQRPCWLDSDLRLPDEDRPSHSVTTTECRRGDHSLCGQGVIVRLYETGECACRCHTAPPKPKPEAPRHPGVCSECGGETSNRRYQRCGTCSREAASRSAATKRPVCVDCGRATSHPRRKRCMSCAAKARSTNGVAA